MPEEKETTPTQATTETEQQPTATQEVAQSQTEAKKEDSQEFQKIKNENATARTNMLDIYNKIVNYNISTEQSKSTSSDEKISELINILNNYRWTIDSSKAKGKDSFSGNVPFVRINEFKQLYSSQLTNTINSIMSISNVNTDEIVDAAADIGKGIIDSVKNITESLTNSSEAASGQTQQETKKPTDWNKYKKGVKDALKNVYSWLENRMKNLENIYKGSHIKSSDLLKPYLYLYATQPTGKGYVFPLLTDDAATIELSNTFGDTAGNTNNQSHVESNPLTKALTEVPQTINAVANDILQLADLTKAFGDKQPEGDFLNNWVEMGKFYNYGTEGDELTVKFPLFNTVKQGEWLDNHRFIYCFALRNMPFKVDNASYKMPLLYDVQVPGVKRMPFAYVKSFKAEGFGVVRTLSGVNYVKEIIDGKVNVVNANEKTSYNVPEAWMITIVFKDLIGPSANKVLSGVGDIPITMEETKTNSDSTFKNPYTQLQERLRSEINKIQSQGDTNTQG